MAFSLEELQRIRKQYDEGRQKKQEEMAKQTNAAPKYRELPSLSRDTRRSREAEEQRSAKAVQARNANRSSDLMAQADRLAQARNSIAPQTSMDMPSQPIGFGNTSVPTDLNLSASPASSLDNLQAEANTVQPFDINKALDPSYKMSKTEEKQAKEVLDNYFAPGTKAYKLLKMSSSNANQASKVRASMTKEEQEEYAKMTSLLNKTSNLSAFTYGMLNIMPFGNTMMNKMGEAMGVPEEYNYSAQKKNVKSQSPLAYMGGDMTSKLAAYSVLGKALGDVPAIGEATNYLGNSMSFGNEALGNVIGNVARGDIADIMLDTIPTEIENYKNGMSAGDIAKDALGNIAINTAFNVGGEGLGQLFKRFGKNATNEIVDSAEDVARNADEVPRISNLEQEAKIAANAQSDLDALKTEYAKRVQAERELATQQAEVERQLAYQNRPRTNLNAEQASNVDEMARLRQALAEQNTPEVPRVGEEQSLVAKQETPKEWNIEDTRDYSQFTPEEMAEVEVAKNRASMREQNAVDLSDKIYNAYKTGNNLDISAAREDVRDLHKFARLIEKLQNDYFYEKGAKQARLEISEADLPDAVKSNYHNNLGLEYVDIDDIDGLIDTFNKQYDSLFTSKGNLRKTPKKITGVPQVGESPSLLKQQAPTDKTEYFRRLLNDEDFLNAEVDKALKNYNANGFDSDAETVRRELLDVARRNLKEAPTTPNAMDNLTNYRNNRQQMIDAAVDAEKNGNLEEAQRIVNSINKMDAETQKAHPNWFKAKETTNTASEATEIAKPKKFFEYVNLKKMQKNIQFDNDADKQAFEAARKDMFSKYQKVMSNPSPDNVNALKDSYNNLRDIAAKGFENDYGYRDAYKQVKKKFIDGTKGMTIKLSKEDLADLPDETITSLNRKLATLGDNTGIKFRKNSGIGIDSMWDDIVTASGNELNYDVNSTQDMVRSLLDYVDNLQAHIANPEIQRIPADINTYLPDEMWDDIAKYARDYDNAMRAADVAKSAEPETWMNEDIGLNPETEIDDMAESAILEGEVPRDVSTAGDYDIEYDTSMPEREVGKVSETYTNTGKNAEGWNAKEYNDYTDPNKYVYEDKTELESINRATRMREDEGRDAFKERILAKELGTVQSEEIDGLMMEWRETVQDARALEESGGDATQLWEESNRIFKKIQEESTHNAQALQALAKWSRNTPEGLLMHTENLLNGKVKAPEDLLQKTLKKLNRVSKKQIEFSPEFQKDFLKKAELLENLDVNSREAKDIMSDLARMSYKQVPVKLNEKIQSLLMDNMLGNFRTLLTRNAGGNVGLNAVEQMTQRPLAAAYDRLVSHKTGVRAQVGLSKEGLQEYLSGFKKGLGDEWHDIKTGLHTARTGENTMENALAANRHVFKNKILDKFDSFVKNGLSIGDRPFYEAVYKQTLGDYNRLRATGQMGELVNNLSDADFKTYAETAAHLNALTAVYQNDSGMAKALLGFKRDIGALSEGTLGFDILSQFSMPFVKTPANVVDRAIDYSPLGLLRNTVRTAREGGIGGANFNQNRFVNELSRNTIGTGLMGGAAVLANKSGITGGFSDDKKEKQAQRQSGMQEYALNWNSPFSDKQYNMDISWLPVVGSNAVAAAAAVDAYKKGEGNPLSNFGSGLAKGTESLFEQSMFQGLQRLFGGNNNSFSSYTNDENGIVGNALNTIKSGTSQAIPSLVRQVAQATDKYQRDLTNSNGGNYTINSMINNIPGLREAMLAPKVDTNGRLLEESQGRGLGMRILEDMVLPGKLTEIKSNALDEEAKRISEVTGNEDSFRPKVSRSKIDPDNKMSNEEWTKYEQTFYKAMEDIGTEIMDTDEYQDMEDADREKILKNAYGDIRDAINSEYTGKDVTGGAKAYIDAGGDEEGIEAVLEYNLKRATLNSRGFDNKETYRNILENDGEEGLDTLATIKEAGGNKKTYDMYSQYNSKAGSKTVPSLDASSFMSQVSKIEKYNKDGKTNGQVSQQELADYLNANNYSISDATDYIQAFFGDNYIADKTKKGRIYLKKVE